MSYCNSMNFERISEEANADVLLFPNSSDPFLDMDLDLFNESSLSDISISGVCDYTNFVEAAPDCVEPNELDRYFPSSNSIRQPFEYDNSRALINNSPVQIIGNDKKSQSSTNPIELSQSVGVGLPQKIMKASHKVHIMYPLELFFRPRYKSDYFAQNGKSRKPRYVADRHGNHFITLQVPAGVRGQIRVDWLTVADKSGDRYSMPYRFQQSNESPDVPDCNPIFININADKNGTVKLYLVLIKSKQDELKNLQPLKPFRPLREVFGMPEKNKMELSYPLNPKQLIQKYQLDQSQLAFTFCALAADGQSRITEWDTTVFSTVLTELAPENSKQKIIACPNCMHSFPITVTGGNGEQDSVQETVSNKRKGYGTVNELMIKKRQFSN